MIFRAENSLSKEIGLDPLILGRRIRHFRNRRGFTLDRLGEMVAKPAPYLSLLENGKKEPKIGLLVDIAEALEVDVSELIDASPPTRRDQLEVALLRAQETQWFASTGLPTIKPSSKLDDSTLAQIVGLQEELRLRSTIDAAGTEQIREANGALSAKLSEADGYLADLEVVAKDALRQAGYSGTGPFTSRNLLDLTTSLGYELVPIGDMPSSARSIVDEANSRIYIAQRNELRTRQARKAVLQTLAGFLLDHEVEPDLPTFLRQRMETAYLAAAILIPEESVVAHLDEARRAHDLNVEDVKELFYASYEMAAWRTANLATRHMGMQTHLIVSDRAGTIVKGYANNGLLQLFDTKSGLETQRVCKRWGARLAYQSPERFAVHYQYTDTPVGTFFCSTHIEAGRDPAHAVTLGVSFDDANSFRGRDTDNRQTSSCPDPACCTELAPDLAVKWHGNIRVSARAQQRILGLIAADPYPDLDMADIVDLVAAHSN